MAGEGTVKKLLESKPGEGGGGKEDLD